jgi:hypothetical protein
MIDQSNSPAWAERDGVYEQLTAARFQKNLQINHLMPTASDAPKACIHAGWRGFVGEILSSAY